MDRVFAVRQECENYLANGKYVFCFWTFSGFGKCICQMLRVYGVGGKLLKVVQTYVYDMACVWVGMDVSEWFPVNFGLRNGCVLPPWLFIMYGWMVRWESEC